MAPSNMWTNVKDAAVKYCDLVVRPSLRRETPEREVQLESGEQIPLSDQLDGNLRARIVPERSIRNQFKIPVFMILISVTELAFFLYFVFHVAKAHCISVTDVGPFPKCSVLVYNPRRRDEPWRLLTYSLVHSGWMHITSNIIGILLGSLMTSVSDPTSYLAGASGGVYALLAAYLASVLLNCKEMESIIEWLLSAFFILVGIIDLAMAVYRRYISDNIIEENIGYVAHLGGALAGILVGVNVLRNVKKEKWENYLRLTCFIAFAILVLICILINAFGGSKIFLDPDSSKIWDCEYKDDCNNT